MQTSDFDYNLPVARIAQEPAKPRDHSRLLVMDRRNGTLVHEKFFHLPDLLRKGDVLVFNNSKVIKARLAGKKESGGKMEIFLLRKIANKKWDVLVGGKGARIGRVVHFGKSLHCTLTDHKDNKWVAEFSVGGHRFEKLIARIGDVPLPPYIKKRARLSAYQTVYAAKEGSVAAPTAGLHFTPRLLKRLRARGVQLEYVTLHVGLGTFQPVKTSRVEDHDMHAEFAEISPSTADRLNTAKKEGRRIIAVGTTSVRTLESFTDTHGIIHSTASDTDIFIYPGYTFRCIDGMITNFHLPQSSLIMLVSAFASRGHILRAYQTAIGKKYRFYSFGDAMLIM